MNNPSRRTSRTCLLLLALLASLPAHADEVSVAVASNFTVPMKLIAGLFEKDTGHRAVPAFGSTGQFYAQIRNGAPFELLLSADDETPTRLVKEAAAVAGTQFTYAMGKLVLWSSKTGFVDGKGDVLRKARFDRLAVANPRLAPYGAAGMQVLKALGLLDALQPKIVVGENINLAYQYVATGNAQLGFVALSQVIKNGGIRDGSAWIVPPNLYEPIRQDAVILERGRGKPGPEAFVRFLQSPKVRALIAAHGYD